MYALFVQLEGRVTVTFLSLPFLLSGFHLRKPIKPNMGISGLLPALKSIQVTRHLSEFSGQTLAVDAYVWLHKGVFTCATELATGKNTNK